MQGIMKQVRDFSNGIPVTRTINLDILESFLVTEYTRETEKIKEARADEAPYTETYHHGRQMFIFDTLKKLGYNVNNL